MLELRTLMILEDDILYQEKDHAHEVYMIKSGKIKLSADCSDWLIENNESIFLTTG